MPSSLPARVRADNRSPPANVRRLLRRVFGRLSRWRAEPLLARAQQAVAQLALFLGRRVPLVRGRAGRPALEAEQLQEQGGRAVEHGAELRAPGLLDQPALEERRRSPSRR